jgi:hypothetical protein
MTNHAHTRRKPRDNAEDRLQKFVVDLMRFCRADGVIFYAVPNGLPSSPRTVARFKGLGMLPGVADLVIVLPGGQTRFLELKSPKGVQQPEQIAFMEACKASETPYKIARTPDEAVEILSAWGALKRRPAAQLLRSRSVLEAAA